MTRRLVAILGATATGKTALAVSLARALDGEVVNADSRQVYRWMDIGTAKPTAEEQAAARHHLIDLVEPDEPFSLGQWLDLAQDALDDVWSRGKQPLLAGGTGQYVWALLEGWRVPRVPPRPEVRARLEARSPAALVDDLRRVDPEAAATIDPRNLRRIVRALEVYETTGRPFSYWRSKAPPEFETLVLGLRLARAELYRRIDERAEGMIAAGLEDEVRRLGAAGYSCSLPSMSGMGYREMCEYISGQTDLDAALSRIKTGTHRFARHQNAWFKADDPRIRWIEAPGEEAFEEARRLAVEFLQAGAKDRR